MKVTDLTRSRLAERRKLRDPEYARLKRIESAAMEVIYSHSGQPLDWFAAKQRQADALRGLQEAFRG